MQVEITFGDELTQLSPAAAARILADVNYLLFSALALVGGRAGSLPLLPIENSPERYGPACAIQQAPDGISYIQLHRVEFGSPFKLVTVVFHPPNLGGRLTMFLDALIERLRAQNELRRQEAIAASLRNLAEMQRLLADVPQSEREKLEKAMVSSLTALIDGRHPTITNMKVEIPMR